MKPDLSLIGELLHVEGGQVTSDWSGVVVPKKVLTDWISPRVSFFDSSHQLFSLDADSCVSLNFLVKIQCSH